MEPAIVESVQVNIFHRTYKLRSHSSGERIKQIAQLVDERMQLISSQLATHDVTKIAVLVALNIADEMQSLKDRYERDLQTLLSQSLNPPPAADQTMSSDGSTVPGGNEQQSWFEDIFGSAETKSEAERLSSRVTAKLQLLRQSEQETNNIEVVED